MIWSWPGSVFRESAWEKCVVRRCTGGVGQRGHWCCAQKKVEFLFGGRNVLRKSCEVDPYRGVSTFGFQKKIKKEFFFNSGGWQGRAGGGESSKYKKKVGFIIVLCSINKYPCCKVKSFLRKKRGIPT